ncbi:MAG: S1 RNA-binding domain-containing protein [Phycisphaerales bacterium]|nr:MAG: S1 RNA-binding domain-containing protein [Phycisphaerales bacterium]
MMKHESSRKRICLQNYVSDAVGLPALNDIMQELSKPGRDPRKKSEMFTFAEGVKKIEDVEVAMKLPGVVTNITAFGAFVAIGVHHDGLMHISQLADHCVKDPADIVSVHQKVTVSVIDMDLAKKRTSLSMKGCRQ